MIQAIIHHRHCSRAECEEYSRVYVRYILTHTGVPEHHCASFDGGMPEGPCRVGW
jgi:hypothetical protein